METKTKKTVLKTADEIKKEMPKFSKTWLAVLASKGTGKIIDMRAVLK